MDGSNLDEGFTTGRKPLEIASQSSPSNQPGKGSLDNPAFSLDLKASFRLFYLDRLTINENPIKVRGILRMRNNLRFPAQMLLNPITQRTGISMVSKQMTHAGKAVLEVF